MDAFLVDLGVDIPPPAGSGSRRDSQGGNNTNDDTGGDMDIDDDDEFELWFKYTPLVIFSTSVFY